MADSSLNLVDRPTVVAHRGASSSHPENTISSFQAAFDIGAPLVELDVRLSADGVLVVIHDPDLGRTTDGSGWVHQTTFEQLRAVNAGSPDRPEPIPTFREVLEVARGRGGLVVEIKNIPGEPAYEQDREAIVEAAVTEIEASRFDRPIVVISFNPRSINAAKAAAPNIPTGFLFTDALDPEAALSIVLDGGHEFAFPGYRAVLSSDALVDRAHAEGLRVGTWTVDEPGLFRRLLDRGVDAIASNDPAMGLKVLFGRKAGRRSAPRPR